MPSPESQALVDIYKAIIGNAKDNPGLSLEAQRMLVDNLHSAAAEPTDVTYEEVQCPGTRRPAIWCKPVTASSSHVILYLHGGAGYAGSPSSHRKVAAHLAKAAGSYALVLDYRLTPENVFPAAMDDAVSAHRWLLGTGVPSTHIATAGDSAGGNLAVASVLKLKELGVELPAATVLFSPWLDMESTGATMKTNAETDAVISAEGGAASAAMYLGSASPRDQLANPLYADFKGMPPLYVVVGTAEVLQSDSERIVELAKEAGVEAELELVEQAQHVHVFMAGRAVEADKSISNAGTWLKRKFGLP